MWECIQKLFFLHTFNVYFFSSPISCSLSLTLFFVWIHAVIFFSSLFKCRDVDFFLSKSKNFCIKKINWKIKIWKIQKNLKKKSKFGNKNPCNKSQILFLFHKLFFSLFFILSLLLFASETSTNTTFYAHV